MLCYVSVAWSYIAQRAALFKVDVNHG